MEWKEIPEMKGYFINKHGEVKNSQNTPVKTHMDHNGYLRIFKTIHVKVHRAVMLAFCPEEQNQVVRHLDGNKLNNNFTNLKWGTYKENYSDMVAHGNRKIAKGLRSASSKITDDDVREIRKRAKNEPMKIIAQDYPISYGTITRIVRGKYWPHIQ